MKLALMITSTCLCALLCGCSRKPPSATYENFGTGESNPKAAPILKVVKSCLEDFQAKHWSSLHDKMTATMRTAMPEAQLAAQCEMLTEKFGLPANVGILEVHFAEFPKRPANAPPTALGAVEGNSQILPNPIRLASPVSGSVAFILCNAISQGPGLKSWMTLVLHKENDVWGLVCVNMNNCEAKEHDGKWFANRAQEFESKGMRRIAFLYRNFGAQLLIPSPYIIVLSASQQIQEAAKQEAPPNIPYPGIRPSEIWRADDGTEFMVELVCIVSAPSFLSLEVRYKSTQKELDSQEAKDERQKLYRYIIEQFPEYRDAFDGIFVSSFTSSANGFRDYFPFNENESESSNKSMDSDKQ